MSSARQKQVDASTKVNVGRSDICLLADTARTFKQYLSHCSCCQGCLLWIGLHHEVWCGGLQCQRRQAQTTSCCRACAGRLWKRVSNVVHIFIFHLRISAVVLMCSHCRWDCNGDKEESWQREILLCMQPTLSMHMCKSWTAGPHVWCPPRLVADKPSTQVRPSVSQHRF